MVLDPITAIGVAGNIIQFVEFGCRCASNFHTIWQEGTLPSFRELEADSKCLEGLTIRLQTSPPSKTVQDAAAWETGILQANERCQDVAVQLRNVCDKVNALNGRRFKALRQTIRTQIKEREIHALREQLEAVKTRLTLHLVAYLSVQRQSELQEIARVSKTAAEAFKAAVRKDCSHLSTQLDDLKSAVGHGTSTLQQAVHDWQQKHETELAETSVEIVEETKRKLTEDATQKMLASLYFVQIEDRRDMITETHATTFDWIFDGDCLCNNHDVTFSDWLRGEQPQNGLFWIRGKPGSGKSCLMSYVSTHPKLSAPLQEWAGSNELLLASAFFWIAGTTLQKSLIGMLRTLLYQFLEKKPHLMQIAHPERWRAYYWHQASLDEWSEQELRSALGRLFGDASDTVCFMILVDGLDEYQGTEAQHKDLVNFFVQITSQYRNIKACLSSRPWLIFEEGFKRYPSLSLHDLTEGDVATYVRDHFKMDENFSELRNMKPEECDTLEQQIVDKASGVFLWVALVVRDLLQCLQDGNAISSLFKKLDSIPAELDGYFMQIIESITVSDRAAAAKILLLVMTLPVRYRTIMTLSFIEEEQEDYALHLAREDFSRQSLEYRISLMKRRLKSKCKGLLEVGAGLSLPACNDWRIEFMHGSFYEFFCQSTEVRDRLREYACGLPDVSRYLCNALLVQVLALVNLGVFTVSNFETIVVEEDALASAVAFLYYASKNERETASLPLSLLAILRHLLVEHWPAWNVRCASTSALQYEAENTLQLFTGWKGQSSDFLKLAVQYGLSRAVAAELKMEPPKPANDWNLDELVRLSLEPVAH
ncbi:hypothetical protein EDD37DRAFT_142805 [Exophiala viscosa]|uniref:NACHT domain-containing protein n=1 Tax=Exophiala viscosa TaxID=2486360 RepID=A0AAN6I9V6_9EURO|nr:hypothetical protein EDD36DRAFT_86524 [Exophiala viscosa]KAI1621048.1 hypothetical protein EDD37DRAFT_142805 [Exophiala viscosa]